MRIARLYKKRVFDKKGEYMSNYDFLDNSNRSMIFDAAYENIYGYFSKKLEIQYAELFTLCVSVGFRNNLRIPIKNRGKEFKAHTFRNLRYSLYSIILNHNEFGRDIEKFKEPNFQNTVINLLQEYANGGMKILCDEVFRHNWTGNELDPSYDEYLIDVMTYVMEEGNKAPF
jgi:hypothetical protein